MNKFWILAFTASLAWGQGNGSLRARELFYTPPPDAALKAPVAATPKPETKTEPKPDTRIAVTKSAPKPVAPVTSAKSIPSIPVAPKPTEHTETVVNAPAPAMPLGLRYSVLKRDTAGKFIEVDPDSTFHSGDRIRLELQANSPGYLYIVAQGTSGNWQVLFPSREVAGGSNQVHRGEVRQIPSGDRGQFVFDEQAGAEKLFIVLSRQPEQNLDQLIYTMRKTDAPEPARVMMAQASVSDDVISRIRGEMNSRDLVFEKVENATVAQTSDLPMPGGARIETAAFVANPSTASDARVVADLKLKHE